MTASLADKKGDFSLTLPSDREIRLTRSFAAPRALVFDAWTKPEHVRNWWGCANSSLTTCEIDLRVGGAWRYVLRAPDGSVHPFKGVYREIERPDRLVHTQVYDIAPYDMCETVVTVLFAEKAGRTTVSETILHLRQEFRDGHVASGMEGGAAESFARLEELLASMA